MNWSVFFWILVGFPASLFGLYILFNLIWVIGEYCPWWLSMALLFLTVATIFGLAAGR
jgi:hypothetical protein